MSNHLSAFLRNHGKPYQTAAKLVLVGGLVVLAGCQGVLDGIDGKANAPIPRKLVGKMKAQGMTVASPIMLRIFKQESTLEVWKKKDTGRYGLVTSYDICKYSGNLGPKFKEGDRQAPEGFYTVTKRQMNPNSAFHLSFNMGFPNSFDRSHGRTGSHLMIHGACSSAGCYSMTDEKVEEIYAFARESLNGGQKAFQIQAFPFRPTAENMVKHRNHKHFEFWKMLKRGYDHFEITRVPPKVDVCGKEYRFNTSSNGLYIPAGSCPVMKMPKSLALAYTKRSSKYANDFEALLAKAESRDPVALQPLELKSVLPDVLVDDPAAVKKPLEVEEEAVPATDKVPPADKETTAGVPVKRETTSDPAG